MKHAMVSVFCIVSVLLIFGCGGGGTASDPVTPPVVDTGSTATDEPSSKIIKKFTLTSSSFDYDSPTIQNGYIYIGTANKLNQAAASGNAFYKLDIDLNKVWEYSLGVDEVRGSAAIDSSGNLYFCVLKGRVVSDLSNAEMYLYSLDNSGALRWTKKILAKPFVPNFGTFNPSIDYSGNIVVGGDKVYCLNSSNGSEIWTYYVDNYKVHMEIFYVVIDSTGNLFFQECAMGILYSLTSSGSQRWSYALPETSPSGIAFTKDQSKIVFGAEKSIYCLTTASGTFAWKYTASRLSTYGHFFSFPAIDDADVAYIGSKGNGSGYLNSAMYAINPDGTLKWETVLEGDLYNAPCLGDAREVYVGSEINKYVKRFNVLNMDTGEYKWGLRIVGDVTESMPALVNGHIYIGTITEGGSSDPVPAALYKIKVDSSGYLSGAASPRFMFGNESTGRK